MHPGRRSLVIPVALVGVGLIVGFVAGSAVDRGEAQETKSRKQAGAKAAKADGSVGGSTADKSYDTERAGATYLKQSPAAVASGRAETDYGLGENHGSKLPPYPPGGPGVRTPLDLWRYAGKSGGSWSSPDLPMSWDRWVEMCREQKPKLMADVHAFMTSRFDFHGDAIANATMTGGKPVMAGPVARLARGAKSFDALAEMSPAEIKKADLFPYKPLAHPLQTTAHMLFPASWIRAHPEHERMDVDLDIPEAYLPEFPPPMFLTTHKELGDVSRGREVTLANYYEIFNGLLTAEQMEGLKELLRPSPTTWFNQTEHRVTYEPSAGVACFSCHVNGHTNVRSNWRRTRGPIRPGSARTRQRCAAITI